MRESTVELVEESVRLIEEKLKSPLWLDDLAKGLYISKYHLHRLFKALTGKTLMSYVRGRRLTRSISELVGSGAKICDIAQEYCFNYEQSYERAFKSQFGVSPTAFRRSPCELDVTQMYDTCALRGFGRGIFIEPRFCFLPQITVAGICSYISTEDDPLSANAAALNFCYNEREKIPSRVNEHIYIGFGFPSQVEDYIYMPCVEVTKTDTLPPPFEHRKFPAHMYAVFRYVGFHSPDVLSDLYIGYVYEYIESEWSQRTSYKRNTGYLFERMDTSICSSTYCEVDVYIPVMDSSMPVVDFSI